MIRPEILRVRPTCRAYSLVGLLITIAIVIVLWSILMTAMNKRVTGEGSTVEGTVNSMTDQIALTGLYQGFAIYALENNGRFLVPSDLTRSGDPADNTTANMYSAMIAANYIVPAALISQNEYGNVYEDDDYNYSAVQPQNDQFWDPNFSADLWEESNVSYAHLPLFDERMRKNWRNTARFPVIGNRGPKDGIDNPSSYTYGRNGKWAGHIVFGDGSISFLDSFTMGQFTTTNAEGEPVPDNIFRMEEGPRGEDVILGFTKTMTPEGPVLDWD